MAERPFAGKVALVTGGSRGIGRACVLKLAQLGADVAVNYSRSAEDAEATAHEAAALGVRAATLQADMGDQKAVHELFGRVAQEFGRLDALVNSAARGLERPRGALESLPKHLRHTMDVNLFGPWFCAQEAAKLIAGGGAIVNLLSPGAERYLPRYAAVGVSKGALATLTTYLAVELAPRGIRVNGVSAGLVDDTDGVRMLPEELLERYRERVPAGRLVRPEEVADAVAFLCSDAAAMIVGQVLLVDGGYTLVGVL
ncbi:MAG: SDR family oxidoreductase [Dehalococcoidia bacterium]